MKPVYLLFILLMQAFRPVAQTAAIDSLENILRHNPPDTQRVRLYNVLAGHYTNMGDYREALAYVKKSKQHSEKILGVLGKEDTLRTFYLDKIASASIFEGNVYLYLTDLDSALLSYTRAMNLAAGTGNKRLESMAYGNIGMIWKEKGDYDKAVKHYLEAIRVAASMKDSASIATKQIALGSCYRAMGDYARALAFQLKALHYFEARQDLYQTANSYNNIGNIYLEMKNYAYALSFFNHALKNYRLAGNESGEASVLLNTGTVHHNLKNDNKAIADNQAAYTLFQIIGDSASMSLCLGNIANSMKSTGRYLEALETYKRSLSLQQQIGQQEVISSLYMQIAGLYGEQLNNTSLAHLYLDSASVISDELKSPDLKADVLFTFASVYEHARQPGKALGYFKRAVALKDSILNKEVSLQLAEMTTKYETEKKDHEITLLKVEKEKDRMLAQAEISKQKIIRNSIAGGTGVLILSSVFSFLFYKRKRDATFKSEVSEVEMKALRAQMNPHFIFNSLNSIYRFMEKKETEAAGIYLGKFSRVMRLILENSEFKEVPLEDDLKALELYMQLEALRMDGKFTYEIKVDDAIDRGNTLIPPLILQPFVENAIWHGISNKEGRGKINIFLSSEGDMLTCIVEDDGIGRAQSTAMKVETKGKKSLGMKITKARIDILNRIKKCNAGVELIDLAHGMKVVVKLPLELAV